MDRKDYINIIIVVLVVIFIVLMILLILGYFTKKDIEKKDDLVLDLANVSDSIIRMEDESKRLQNAIDAEQSPEQKVILNSQLTDLNQVIIEKNKEKDELVKQAEILKSEAEKQQTEIIKDVANSDSKLEDSAAIADVVKTDSSNTDVQVKSENAAEVAVKLNEANTISKDLQNAIDQTKQLPTSEPVIPTSAPIPAPIPVADAKSPALLTVAISENKTSPFVYKNHTLVILSKVTESLIMVAANSVTGRFSEYMNLPGLKVDSAPITEKISNHSLVGIQEIIDSGIAKIRSGFRDQVDKLEKPVINRSLYPGSYRGVSLYIHRIKYVDSDTIEYKPDPLVDPLKVKSISTTEITYLADAIAAEKEIKANIDKKLGNITYYLKGNDVYNNENKLIERVKYEKRPLKEGAPISVDGKRIRVFTSDLMGAQLENGIIQQKNEIVACPPGSSASELKLKINGGGIGKFALTCMNLKTKRNFVGPISETIADSPGTLLSIPLRTAVEIVDQGGRITRLNNNANGNVNSGYKSFAKPTGFRVECPSGARISGFEIIGSGTNLNALALRCEL